MFELFGMAPRRIILGPMTNTRLEALVPSNMANNKDLIDLCIMGEEEFIERTILPLCPCLHLDKIIMLSGRSVCKVLIHIAQIYDI